MANSAFYEYRLQKECPECGHPLIINGPKLKILCGACNSLVSIKKTFWVNFFKRDEESGVFISGERIGPQPGKKKAPECHHCKTKLPIPQSETISVDHVTCEKCQTVHNVFSIPEWMKKMKGQNNRNPRYIFCAEREGDERKEDILSQKPIAFSCINCGGSLTLTPETPRVMECQFCGTQQFLPASLWHALHPVRKIKPWYVLY